jgi:hypothetical protein
MAWVTVPGSNNIWEYENTATSSDTYPDAAGTYSGGIRTYTKPGTSDTVTVYARTRIRGEINQYIRSEEFNLSWTTSNTTVNANSTADPNGDITADALLENAGSGKKEIYQITTFVSGTQYTMSVFAKTNGRHLQLQPAGSIAGATNFANFNLTTGTLGTVGAAADNATIKDYGNGWFRCSITMTSTVTGPTGIGILLIKNDTDARGYTYSGDGTSGIFIWGAMLSEGAIVKRYIKTTNSASTTIERGELSKTYYDAQ